MRGDVRVKGHGAGRGVGRHCGTEMQCTRDMETTNDLLGQLRSEWARISRTVESRRATEVFVRRHHDLDLNNIIDLGDLVIALESRSGKTVVERARIVQALLEDASDPRIHRALLQTLLPGIVSVCRQLRFGRGVVAEPSEALDEALSLASELLSDWAGESRAYAAPDILSALRGRLRRWLLKEKAARSQLALTEHMEPIVTESSHLLTRLASERHGTNARLAQLTYERVFEGRAIKDLAREDRTSPQMLQMELQQFALKFLL